MEEWPGKSSHKFGGTKKHFNQQHQVDPQYRTLFSTSTRKHFDAPQQNHFEWRPSRTIVTEPDRSAQAKAGLKIVNQEITQNKPRPQMKHYEETISERWEDNLGGVRTFVHDNRKTMTEYLNTDKMGHKKRCDNMFDQRNAIGIASLGDKAYKAP